MITESQDIILENLVSIQQAHNLFEQIQQYRELLVLDLTAQILDPDDHRSRNIVEFHRQTVGRYVTRGFGE